MNFLAISLVLMAVGGALFGMLDGSRVISNNSSAILSVVSIMAAAILVRLNRGIPTVDWKSVDREALDELLDRLEDIAKAYVVTFIVTLVNIAIVMGVLLISAGKYINEDSVILPLSVSFGVAFGLLVSRISYIIWLDLDIVRLQRSVIVSAAESSNTDKQVSAAADKIAQMNQVRVTPL